MMAAVSRHQELLSTDELRAINDFKNSSLFSELEKAVLRYATELTGTPVVVDDENFQILKANFSEKQLVELTSSIAWENWRARFDHAFGIESAGFAEAAPLEVVNTAK